MARRFLIPQNPFSETGVKCYDFVELFERTFTHSVLSLRTKLELVCVQPLTDGFVFSTDNIPIFVIWGYGYPFILYHKNKTTVAGRLFIEFSCKN